MIGLVQASAEAQLFLVPLSSYHQPAPDVVALGWNASPDTNATGYYLYWGMSSTTCTNLLDVGNATSTAVGGLATNVAYYFDVVAHDAAGDASQPSNLIAYAPVPPLNVLASGGGSAAGVTLGFEGVGGIAYFLQATLDFTTWETIFMTNCAVLGPVAFQPGDAGIYPRRFYRLTQQ